MRILLLSGGVLAAVLLQASSKPASAEGPWCYQNENLHCGEVSFESCHFGTLGNGGYCYPNPAYRSQTRGRTEARTVPRYNQGADNLVFAVYRQPDKAWTNDSFGDWNNDRRNNRQSNRYQDDWSFSASYEFAPKAKVRVARHHRHRHKKTRRAIASVDFIPTVYDGLAAIALALHAPSGNALEAFAFANPSPSLTVEPTNAVPAVAAPIAIPKGFPNIDFARSCRATAQVGFAQGVGIAQGTDGCMSSETEARNQLARDWNLFSPADRSSCTKLTTMGGGGTYTSLLTCLELKRDVAMLQRGGKGEGSRPAS